MTIDQAIRQLNKRSGTIKVSMPFIPNFTIIVPRIKRTGAQSARSFVLAGIGSFAKLVALCGGSVRLRS